MNLLSDLPMHLMGATYNEEKDEVRFLFYYPNKSSLSDWQSGFGAVLLVSHPEIYNEDGDLVDLATITETVDTRTGERGIPAGIGMSKSIVQIVGYEEADFIYSIRCSSVGYVGKVPLDKM